ncbi:unnamed protein product [Polarella glacialis]|uniref:BTB domain-containing protein n=1 Tax=Polarella glacialis TaxID=89957 RepID=A0A813IQK7_POLGL|nr:unnamed protein product [Polarella glacialis]
MEPPEKRARSNPVDTATSWAVQTFENEGDVEVVVEGTTLRVHSAILGLASPVFATLLRNGMQEGLRGKIELPGKSKEEFELFMSYLRPGSTKRMTEATVDIMLPWFDHYEVSGWKAECQGILQSMPVTTARLFQAHRYNLQEQYHRCLKDIEPKEFVSQFEEFAKMPKLLEDFLPIVKEQAKYKELESFFGLLEGFIGNGIELSSVLPILALCLTHAELLEDDLCTELSQWCKGTMDVMQVMQAMLTRLLAQKGKALELQRTSKRQVHDFVEQLSERSTRHEITRSTILRFTEQHFAYRP